jgi:hypothetical protein
MQEDSNDEAAGGVLSLIISVFPTSLLPGFTISTRPPAGMTKHRWMIELWLLTLSQLFRDQGSFIT